MSLQIAVIGAGLGGLTLACTLRRYGVTAAVYDADASAAARPQGGLLDIDSRTGQAALREAGLHEAFTHLIRAGEDAKRITDRDGTVLLDRQGEGVSGRPEVDRGDLRALLIDRLPADTVRWSRKAVDVVVAEGRRPQVRFVDGSSVTADVVVGADGAWSRVRRSLSRAVPQYTGTCFIEIGSTAGRKLSDRDAGIVGRGTLMAVEPGQGVMIHHNADGTLSGYLALNGPFDALASLADGPESLRDAVAARFGHWAPALRRLVLDHMNDPVLRPIHALPVAHRWDRVPGVTLVGDAAHLMSPFAGEGANLAMYDGAALAAAIADHPRDLETALSAYERALFPRSHACAHRSADNLRRFFGPGAPGSTVELFDPDDAAVPD